MRDQAMERNGDNLNTYYQVTEVNLKRLPIV